MNKLLVAVIASVMTLVLPATTSFAADTSAFAAVTSNYVFRGQTQTKDSAAVQGGYDIKQSKDDMGWYAGVFASTVDVGVELDLFGGWKGAINQQMGYDVGAIHYKYTDNGFAADATEIYAGINYETAYAKLFMGTGNTTSTYLDLGASFIVLTDIDLDLHAGHYFSSLGTTDVSAALSMEVKNFNLSLGTTYEDGNNELEFFVTVGKTFDL